MAGLKVITPPASEPVTLADVKPQLRIELDDTSYDAILTPLITVAREWCEGYQNRAYITQTLELALDGWPCDEKIELPRPPLQSVTSLTYTDSEGVSTVWPATNYVADDYSFVARLVKANGVSWPTVSLPAANGIKVRYAAGYGVESAVPKLTKQAIILYAAEMFESPGCQPSDAVKSLLNLDRVVPV